jgi:YHS domain-containing protein
MITNSTRLAISVAAVLLPSLVWAQHDAHQPASPQTASAELNECMRVQPSIENIVTAANARAEAARLSNSPSDLRAAVDHLESALRDIRAQLTPCSAAAASTDPHAGHSMPSAAPAPPSQATPIKTEQPATTAPHAGHTTSKPPAAPKVDKPAAPMDHSKMHMGGETKEGKAMDPVNGLMVDPAGAPKTTHQGHTYYFSSEQSRKEFLANPAKFAKRPKG